MDFLRKVYSEPYKELEEQLDNTLTILQVLELNHITHTCSADHYIFGITKLGELNCWDVNTSELVSSLRFNRLFQIEENGLHSNGQIVVVVFANAKNFESEIGVWNFHQEGCDLVRISVNRDKINNALLANDTFILATSQKIKLYHVMKDDIMIEYIREIEKPAVFLIVMEDAIYFANSRTLHAEGIKEKKIFVSKDCGNKIVALEELKNKSIMISCHRNNYLIKIWNKNLVCLRDIKLSQQQPSRNINPCYSLHCIGDCEDIAITYNDNVLILDFTNFIIKTAEKRAHRSDIISVTSYRSKGVLQYLITKCDSAIRLWRVGDCSSLQLVGEIAVSNVDKIIAVKDLGMFLAGSCYDAGLVLWRDSNSFVTDLLKASRCL